MKLHSHDQRSLSQAEMDVGFENIPWSADAKAQIFLTLCLWQYDDAARND
jgi:hypothetical protein